MEEEKRGYLIVFEGIDGVGKSTQVRLLAERLGQDGYEIVRTQEPTTGVFGKKIRELYHRRDSITLADELELFLADRRQHVELLINPALRQGKIVLCDRYFLSTVAYQGAAGLDPQAIIERNGFAPDPDLALLFELAPKQCIRRITEARGDTPNDFEKLESLSKVDAVFRRLNLPYVERIDASRDILQISRLIHDKVYALLDHTKQRQVFQ